MLAITAKELLIVSNQFYSSRFLAFYLFQLATVVFQKQNHSWNSSECVVFVFVVYSILRFDLLEVQYENANYFKPFSISQYSHRSN